MLFYGLLSVTIVLLICIAAAMHRGAYMKANILTSIAIVSLGLGIIALIWLGV